MRTSIKGEKKYGSINLLRGKQTAQKPLDSGMIGTGGWEWGLLFIFFFLSQALVACSAYRGAY